MDIALPEASAPRSWNRTRGTLLNRKARLSGVAIASGERLDASLLFSREEDGHLTIWSLSTAPGDGGEASLGTLFRELAHREPGRVVIPRICDDEASIDVLLGLGFTRGEETIGVVAEAQPRA